MQEHTRSANGIDYYVKRRWHLLRPADWVVERLVENNPPCLGAGEKWLDELGPYPSEAAAIRAMMED